MLFNALKVSFTQEANTATGSEDGYEDIEIKLVTQLPGDDPFIILETEQWSIDSPGELVEVLDKLRNFAKSWGNENENDKTKS